MANDEAFEGAPVEIIKEKKQKIKDIEPAVPVYKLNLYKSNGDIRMEISKGVLYEVSKNWGDLIRIIPSNKWHNTEELVQMVWDWEKRQFRKSFTRSRKQIEDGIVALLEAGIIQEK